MMTDDRMALQSLLAKAPGADLLREMIGFAVQRAGSMTLEGIATVSDDTVMSLLCAA